MPRLGEGKPVVRKPNGIFFVLVVILAAGLLAGCDSLFYAGPRYDLPVVAEADIQSGTVSFAVWPAGIGAYNHSSGDLMLDERELSYWDDGKWMPCVEEGQWADDGWGVRIGAQSVAWSTDSLQCPNTGRLRYGDLVVFDGGSYSAESDAQAPLNLASPGVHALRVAAPGGCLAIRADPDHEDRAVFPAGSFQVTLDNGQVLRAYGCTTTADVPPADEPGFSGQPGVWRVGIDMREGTYQPGSEDALCPTSIQTGDVFSEVDRDSDGESTSHVKVADGELVTTECHLVEHGTG